MRTAPALAGLLEHLRHEWVVLANLFGLLMGFALLSRHFEQSHVPARLPDYLPDDWLGGFVLLVMVFVLSSFLDNIAAALIGGTMASSVFRGRVHIGYLAALVAAANAGGSGSVVGDTTTTMMWIDGVSPRDVLHAYVAAGVALVVFGIPAARQQQAWSPIVRRDTAHVRVDWGRVGVVAWILRARDHRQCREQPAVPRLGGPLAVARRGGLDRAVDGRTAPAPRLERVAGDAARHDLPAVPRAHGLDDAGRAPAGGVVADGVRARLRLGGVRQHPAHQARARCRAATTGACSRMRSVLAAR